MGSKDRLLINKLPTPVSPLLPMEMKATRVLKTSTYQSSAKFDQVRCVLAMGKADSSSDSDIRQARVPLVSVRVSDINSITLFPTERRVTPPIMALRVTPNGGSPSLSFSLSNLAIVEFCSGSVTFCGCSVDVECRLKHTPLVLSGS